MSGSLPITINLFNLRQLKKEIEDYKKWIHQKAHELARELATEGLVEATVRFNDAFGYAQYAGMNDVDINVEQIDATKYAVVASGNAVFFIEFGTGIYRADDPEARSELIDGGDIVGHGQFGQGKGANKAWVYVGDTGANPPPGTVDIGKGRVLTRGNDASSPMYHTTKALERKLYTIAKEVFK